MEFPLFVDEFVLLVHGRDVYVQYREYSVVDLEHFPYARHKKIFYINALD